MRGMLPCGDTEEKDGTMQHFYVTIDRSDTGPIETATPGEYLIIRADENVGISEEAELLATATDLVHAREIVKALRNQCEPF